MADFKTRQVTRDKLSRLAGGNQELIKLFENLVSDVSTAVPSSLDEVEAAANDGRALAQAAQGMALLALELAKQLDEAPRRAEVVEAFPVGGVFVSTVATDPSQLLGYGVWAAYAQGQVLVGVLPGDPSFGAPGATGGTKTASISAHAGAAVADHVDHTHQANIATSTFNAAAGATPVVSAITPNPVTTSGSSAVLAHNVTQPNNHADISIVQPYITVFFWLRTA